MTFWHMYNTDLAPLKEHGVSFSAKKFSMQNGDGHKCLPVIDKQTSQFMVPVKC